MSGPDMNPPQRAAVHYIDGPLLVLAGAGSGKTRVITEKVAYLVGECGFEPTRVAAITFTNKAAREMRSRVAGLLPRRHSRSRGLTVSTFHSLGLRILRSEVDAIGYKAGFTLFDAADTQALVRELGASRDEAGARTQQGLISRWKNDLIAPEQAAGLATTEPEAAAARVYAAYRRHLKAYNAVDFDDLICMPLTLFNDHPQVLTRWRHKLHYLLVDEYQDTNAAQYRLLQLLTQPRGAFTVVGDDDQSVYAWRGARPENLSRLGDDFPQLKVIKLEQNYRSSQHILNTANGLIARNPRQFDKRLWSALGTGDPIRVIACDNAAAEAERVVSELLSLRIRKRADWGAFAILYRSNHQARPFEKQLRERNAPYRVSGGQSFFDKVEVKDLVAYLRLLVNPSDDAAFLRIINVPRREIGAATLEKLGAYAGQRRIGLFDAAREIHLTSRLNERAGTSLRHFADWCESLAMRGESQPAQAIVGTLLQDLNYRDWLHSVHKDRRRAERRIANVEELITWIQRIDQGENGDVSLSAVVNRLGLMDILEGRDRDDQLQRVHLMTLHAAKGLEFDHVFLTGMEEDMLPHRNSIEQGTLDEERRLLYVGITRARRTLTLSYATRRRLRGEEQDCEPSRFLQELPADSLAWERRGETLPPEESRRRGRASLDALRDMLGEDV